MFREQLAAQGRPASTSARGKGAAKSVPPVVPEQPWETSIAAKSKKPKKRLSTAIWKEDAAGHSVADAEGAVKAVGSRELDSPIAKKTVIRTAPGKMASTTNVVTTNGGSGQLGGLQGVGTATTSRSEVGGKRRGKGVNVAVKKSTVAMVGARAGGDLSAKGRKSKKVKLPVK